jgi:hypothetical protein
MYSGINNAKAENLLLPLATVLPRPAASSMALFLWIGFI